VWFSLQGGLVVIVDVYDDDDIFPATLNGDEFIDWFLLTAPTGGLVTLRGQSGRWAGRARQALTS
jgi:hypothetical protein